MQLPESLHPFNQPTFIVVTDSVQAKLFKALDRDVELVHVISTKLEPMEQERSQVITGSGGARSADAHENNQKWTREQLYEQLSKDLMHRHQNGEFEALAFTVPQEHVNELKESLHVDLLKIADAWVEKNLTNDELEDIVLHVQEA
ncbi:hypothetical protein EBS80_00470 [bacterium]|nr:hypothetical protein [bacterium]